MKAVILAGGLGSRISEEASLWPKPFAGLKQGGMFADAKFSYPQETIETAGYEVWWL
jgi:dTDP-glucose pyrophosphorylase